MNNRANQMRSKRSQNQQLSVPVKNALRSLRRQDNKTSILVTGPNDPRPIRKDIVVTKVVEGNVPTTLTNVNYNTIYKLLDAGTTPFFTEMRIISVSAFGPAAASGEIRVQVLADGASYLDRGVQGSKRPALHVRLPEVVRIQWVPTSSTNNIIGLEGQTGSTVQYTIEVRGDASADTKHGSV